MTDPAPLPRATYRLQFGKAFTFRDAAAIVPYLRDLGISHVYASPYLKARAGSTHGYDITDHNALNPEVGDEADFVAMTDALAAAGMGQILDFVPNHVGIGQADNAWWLDVLEWGEASPYAGYFDIDWQPPQAALRRKVLVPFLGDHYGRVLENGELTLRFDPQDGSFSLWYYEHRLPLRLRSYAIVLSAALARLRESAAGSAAETALADLITTFNSLRARGQSARRREVVRLAADEARAELLALIVEHPSVWRAIERGMERFAGTPGDAKSFRPLHRLIAVQFYRLAFWRVAASEINYRRFFDINDLAGIRIELPAVFEACHRRVLGWVADGRLHGLRIDHIDGLHDPRQYCRRLTQAVAKAGGDVASGRFPLLVEKILAHHEFLRDDWPITGTTGYEVLNLINGLFVDGRGERPLDGIYRRFAGETDSFDETLVAAKRLVMDRLLGSELQVLANQLERIADANWLTRDFTNADIREALREIATYFPVYRTYVDDSGAAPNDRRDIDWAVAQAQRASALPDRSLFDFIGQVLTTDLVRRRGSGYGRSAVIRFAMRFQQFTGPVMAKAMEDTTFYRQVGLLSLNEVGGDPRRFGVSVAAFHHLNQERGRHWPHSMVSTATHDTKRGEDVRARLDVLSEIAAEWGHRLGRWARLNRSRKRRLRGAGDSYAAPVAADEYLLYQTIVGSWPLEWADETAIDEEGLETYRGRIRDYMVKALREGKRRSTWINPDADYESAVTGFVDRILDADGGRPFLADFIPFQRRVAFVGLINGLAQTVLKLTVPGLPDIYQGCEAWDFSLVDPDNRRPVDYGRRRAVLERLRQAFPEDRAATEADISALLASPADGAVKMLVVWRLLSLRRRHAALFAAGSYLPLATSGGRADHLCAFARDDGTDAVIVVVPRLVADLAPEWGRYPLGADVWVDTRIDLPTEVAAAGTWRDVLTGAVLRPGDGGTGRGFLAADLLSRLPVAVLVSEPTASQ